MGRCRAVALLALALALCMCALPPSCARLVFAPSPAMEPAFAPSMMDGVAASPISTDSPDPCAADGLSTSAVPMEDAVACQKSFPFDLHAATATIETLLKTLPNYVFTDLARDSPEPLLPSKVLLEEGLHAILESAVGGEYASEFDFEMAVQALFNSLNDAHTQYRPICFSRWSYRHGFVLMSLVEDGRQKIVVAPAEVQPFLSLNFPDYLEFVGWEVVEIDGTPAVAYITSFAQEKVGKFKDLNARFNSALFNFYVNVTSGAGVSYGDFYDQNVPPASPSITFLFSNGTHKAERTVIYYAVYDGLPFFSKTDYFAMNCMVGRADDQAPGGSESGRGMAEEGTVPKLDLYVREVITTGSLVAEKVGVIVIPTVSNEGTVYTTTVPFFATFMVSFVLGIEQLKAAGVERVIIDMTQNGGGFIGLANWIVNVLFPKKTKILATRFRASPLAVAAVKTANRYNITTSLYHWSNWAKGGKRTKQFKSAKGFFFPVVKFNYGGRLAPFSQLIRDLESSDLNTLIPEALVKPFKKAPFAAKNILILTNGYCGSSCSIIASSLVQLHGVRTVTVGGIKGHPQQISNFPGGQVLNFDLFRSMLEQLSLGNHALAPQPFVRQVSFTFTWRALYGPISKTTPLEFVFEPSTYNLEYSLATVTSVDTLWGEVAKLF